MAILVLTTQPARVRRIAHDLAAEVVVETDPGLLAARLGERWQLVLIDEDAVRDSAPMVANSVRAGHRTILLTRAPTLAKTIAAIRLGAQDVVNLPIDVERIRRALAPSAVEKPVWEDWVSRTTEHEWVGASPATLGAFRPAAHAARDASNVLIIGESGVGKELLARVIHEQSERARGPFVIVHCGALDETVLASELFGSAAGSHARGGTIAGQLARAAGGTLFLDEISLMSPIIQTRLAAALRQRSYVPIGSFESRPLEARVIAAANRQLRSPAAADEFRQDLLFEFSIEIAVPPLRRRTEDIPLLAMYFLQQLAPVHGKEAHGFEPDALQVLEKYDWPGNVRQLRNVIERAITRSADGVIRASELSELLLAPDPLQDGDPGSIALDAVERRHIRRIWRMTGGHLSETAELLGIHRNTLRRKLEQYGITEEDARL